MIELCNSTDVVEGEILRRDVEGFPAVALTRHEGQIFVFPDTCPHAEESLSEGWVEDGRVVCGVHFAEFELGSGEVHNRPAGCPNLTFFTCEDRDGKVFARLKEEA
ncbi:Rieske 2Fe-2S domain-containing protein [Stappia taiwanensis]|uniref:Rieske 2Fe-2S domain-containing protein n=1 Tax=Stappia taiwanensis TaxID=992267 RepID=A0A838XQX1_9HYPH|nr:Rieske 2Fe-2S domain-containing protein [Stappia taiwanensis]MBA4613649.1 Rieske 2Fe-2S domain-containing protein [Stappia taiwanensis]GGE98497.1 putative ferredoxin subunit of phenylpropionate dioxygenase [Stappia taiwanensis]